MKTFWQDLKKPIVCLAPMEDVTDTVFRQIIAHCGKPDVFFTEFTNVEGLFSKGREHIIHRFQFTKKERPIIAQIWGLNPELFYKAAQRVGELGFDGIDINMGCPVKDVVSHGACSGLIKNPKLAVEIIKATQEGSKSAPPAGGRRIPVSIKTRIGFKTFEPKWIELLLKQNLDALIIHLRTVNEMSKVPAHWEIVKNIIEMRNRISSNTIIIGNGDVQSLADVQKKVDTYNVDGVMVGRGIFHNPWLFNKDINPETVTVKDRLQLLLRHTDLFVKTWAHTKDFNILKKFYKIYVSNFEHASDLRIHLMAAKTPKEVYNLVDEFIKQ